MNLPSELKSYYSLIRPSHWSKNLIIPFGFLMAVIATMDIGGLLNPSNLLLLFSSFIGASLISSGNYVLNDLLDAEWDKKHPLKMNRVIASGALGKTQTVILMILLFVSGLAIAWTAGPHILLFSILLLISGILYNVPPLRMKAIAFIDVMIESANNPLRLLFGWYILVPKFPPVYLLLFLWTYAAVLMTAKRYSELLFLGKEKAKQYRPVFLVYTLSSLRYAYILYAVASLGFIAYVATKIGYAFLIFALLLVIQFLWLYHLMHTKKEYIQKIENVYKLPLFCLYLVVSICVGILLMIGLYARLF